MNFQEAVREISKDRGETLMVAYCQTLGGIIPSDVMGVERHSGIVKSLACNPEGRADFWIRESDFYRSWVVVDFEVLAEMINLELHQVQDFREDLGYPVNE